MKSASEYKGFVFQSALKPDHHGNYSSGHPNTDLQERDRMKNEKKKHQKWLQDTDCTESLEYYKQKLKTIQVIGSTRARTGGGNRKLLKEVEKQDKEERKKS